MTQRQYCIYCNKKITKRSSEHVIQNALGGLYESEDICCPDCNNFISKHIDAPFTRIFNPIISRIDNFSKTNNAKSMPPCTGTVSYNGKTYEANIKGGKVVACPELSRELRCDISKLSLPIIAYNFDIQNVAFQTGIAKIAFNYALSQNVDFKYIAPGLKVTKNGNAANSITYNYNIVPFCPLNPIDEFIEINCATELYHNIILFSQHNELWCYIDLFNTFQFYVLLSNIIPANETIYANYAQTLQKLNRDMPTLSGLNNPKDIMIYAQQYGVKPCMNPQEFSRRIYNALAKKSQKTPLKNLISPRITKIPVMSLLQRNPQETCLLYNSMQLYFANDEFQERNFRTLTPSITNNSIYSYPHATAEICSQHPDILKNYTTTKFNKLNMLLCDHTH